MSNNDFLVRRLRTFAPLNDTDIAAVEALPITKRRIDARETIVAEGDRINACCIVYEGFVCRSKTTVAGKRQILSVHVPGDMPDFQSLFLEVMDYDMWALTDCTLAFVPHDALHRLVRENATLMAVLWRDTLVDAAAFREWIVNVGRRPAVERMAHLFVELKKKLEAVGLAPDNQFEFPLTQTDIADALGLTTVHVNRVLKLLRQEGIIALKRNKLSIENYPRLVELAGFDELYLHQSPDR
jgi:CRP-like cAMP-binding protein